jgi:hypothetical protein
LVFIEISLSIDTTSGYIYFGFWVMGFTILGFLLLMGPWSKFRESWAQHFLEHAFLINKKVGIEKEKDKTECEKLDEKLLAKNIGEDFLNDFKPEQIQEENLVDISNSDLKDLIRAQRDAERPSLRRSIRQRQPEIIDLTQDEIVNEPPSQRRRIEIDLTQDEETSKPSSRRRRVEVETEAASNAATVNRSNAAPSETPFIDSLRDQGGDLFSPQRVAMRQALYEMRKRVD